MLFVVVRGAERSMRIRADLLRLQDTTAQIRVRAALVLFVGFAALAEQLGLEVILGAFIAGAFISLVDRDEVMTHPDFRRKLEAIGFGFFIPVFFVTSGVRFDLDALTASTSNLADGAGLPARRCSPSRGLPGARLPPACSDARHTAIAGLHAGDVAALHRRRDRDRPGLDLIDAAGSAALIGAGLLSVLLFPLGGLAAAAAA